MSATSLSDWLREHPPPDSAYRQSLAGIARRVLAGEEFFLAVRELLDEVAVMQRPEQLVRAIACEPEPAGDSRYDAYLGALAEHLALGRGLLTPAWSLHAVRFLERFWFPSEVKGFRAIAIVAEVLDVATDVFGDRLDAAAGFFVEELFSDEGPR